MTFFAAPAAVRASEVNCHNGSSINGIEGFDLEVFCNPLADRIMFHNSLVRDFALKKLSLSGIDFTDELNPGSAMLGIYITSVEWMLGEDLRGYATSININLNRAALCLLGDDEFHAISSIVWEEDRLIVSNVADSRDFILEVLGETLDLLMIDLRNADPEKYIISSLED
jgi:hypothetical protein